MLTDKSVLVTGGTGSLGRTVVRRLLTGELGMPKTITIFSRDEAKQHYMRVAMQNLGAATDDAAYRDIHRRLNFVIGDMRDLASVKSAVRGQHVIFHAAALKQVPSCERYPYQAVQTNIQGAQNLVQAVAENGQDVESVIGISTDKACKPINVMGMTKAIMERILIEGNLHVPTTRFSTVRYGNVIASRGSVVPLFLEQIRLGRKVTITLPEMTRFLLSLEQAADTVFAALQHSLAGETYIPRVPAAKMIDLATTLIDGRDIPIEIIGIRPGEKIHEIMVSEEEVYRTAERGDYYVIRPMLPELKAEPVDYPPLKKEYSSENVNLDEAGLRRLLAPFMKEDAVDQF